LLPCFPKTAPPVPKFPVNVDTRSDME
jgi:hypothetical protein